MAAVSRAGEPGAVAEAKVAAGSCHAAARAASVLRQNLKSNNVAIESDAGVRGRHVHVFGHAFNSHESESAGMNRDSAGRRRGYPLVLYTAAFVDVDLLLLDEKGQVRAETFVLVVVTDPELLGQLLWAIGSVRVV